MQIRNLLSLSSLTLLSYRIELHLPIFHGTGTGHIHLTSHKPYSHVTVSYNTAPQRNELTRHTQKGTTKIRSYICHLHLHRYRYRRNSKQ